MQTLRQLDLRPRLDIDCIWFVLAIKRHFMDCWHEIPCLRYHGTPTTVLSIDIDRWSLHVSVRDAAHWLFVTWNSGEWRRYILVCRETFACGAGKYLLGT